MALATQALVIGNATYPVGLSLASPKMDAEAVRDALRDLRVEVTDVIDKPYSAALAAISSFVEKVNLSTTTVSILYYSGHGIQINDTNYIVPIDFQDPGGGGVRRLISVQSIVDRMTNATATRIVLLDACRTGKDARLIVGGKHFEIDKAFFLNGVEVPPPGLAEMKAVGNTFIAFAAGPGEVALEGIAGSPLSPFTRALVEHLSAVDLPLSNLTGRVRQEVLEETDGRQRTWDQSSLVVPFYFNPGSLLLFTGNMMALVGLAMSAVIYSLVLSSPGLSTDWFAAALVLPVASFTILIVGAQSAYSRLRGTVGTGKRAVGPQLIVNFRKGTIGGFLGSVVGSLFVSIPYFLSWDAPSETFGQLCLEVTYGAALGACFVGALSLCGAHLCSIAGGASADWRAVRTVLGSALGGMLAGLITAPAITWYFGRIGDRPEMSPLLLLPGSVVGASVVVFSIVNFDLERLSGRRIWTSAVGSLLALISGIPFALVVFAPLYFIGIVKAVTLFLEDNYNSTLGLLVGGACYGVPVGLVLGLVIGVAIVVIQVWSGKPLLT
jgi:uncharacterized caspase-like protein